MPALVSPVHADPDSLDRWTFAVSNTIPELHILTGAITSLSSAASALSEVVYQSAPRRFQTSMKPLPLSLLSNHQGKIQDKFNYNLGLCYFHPISKAKVQTNSAVTSAFATCIQSAKPKPRPISMPLPMPLLSLRS